MVVVAARRMRRAAAAALLRMGMVSGALLRTGTRGGQCAGAKAINEEDNVL